MQLRDCPVALRENESTTCTGSSELEAVGSRNPAKAEVLASLKTTSIRHGRDNLSRCDLETSREVRRSELVRIQSPLSVLVHDQFSHMVLMSSVGAGGRFEIHMQILARLDFHFPLVALREG